MFHGCNVNSPAALEQGKASLHYFGRNTTANGFVRDQNLAFGRLELDSFELTGTEGSRFQEVSELGFQNAEYKAEFTHLSANFFHRGIDSWRSVNLSPVVFNAQ
jgi:hypothetical protein